MNSDDRRKLSAHSNSYRLILRRFRRWNETQIDSFSLVRFSPAYRAPRNSFKGLKDEPHPRESKPRNVSSTAALSQPWWSIPRELRYFKAPASMILVIHAFNHPRPSCFIIPVDARAGLHLPRRRALRITRKWLIAFRRDPVGQLPLINLFTRDPR